MISSRVQTILGLKHFSFGQTLVNRYFSAINQSMVKTDDNVNQNISLIHKQNQQFFRNVGNFAKRQTEEVIAFDPRFGDTFGTIGGNDKRFRRLASEDLPDDDDKYDVLEIKRGPKMAEIGYKKLLEKYINKKPIQLKKALQLYDRMTAEDRIPPQKCTYTLLITGCAKVGFTEKAFQLFEEMLKYELRPTRPAVTALFNACAECPFPEFGLQKARYLKEWLELEGFTLNTIHYHSMIKAFGKLGDMKTAYQIVDEMVANGQYTTDETFAMLLIGCISNKETGLFEAIKIYRRMILHRMPVTIYTFNLLLRAIRDCGLGSEDNLNSLVENTSNRQKYQNSNNKRSDDSSKRNSVYEESKVNSLVVKTPNLLMNNSLNDNIIKIDFNSLAIPSNRFLLFGGIEGFIQLMTDSNVKPNINTLTLMTELIDFKEESEKCILNVLNRFGMRPDTDFFNILIKETIFTRGMVTAKQILLIMNERDLKPDIITFGVLALGCNTFALGKQLIRDMEDMNMKPNVQIMGTLIARGCKYNNFLYINYLIDYMKDNEINPNKELMESLEVFRIKFQKILADFDWNKKPMPQTFKNQNLRKDFSLFKTNYEEWAETVVLEEEEHPWHQFHFQQMPQKKGMHSFIRFMREKTRKRRGMDEKLLHEFEEDELYDQ